jgi:antitoxin MazE
MRATVNRWGNSLALRLPKPIADQAKLVEGAVVELEVDDGKIKVSPARPRYALDDLLKGERTAKRKAGSREVDWGVPRGREAW